jgi:hypothetical protein
VGLFSLEEASCATPGPANTQHTHSTHSIEDKLRAIPQAATMGSGVEGLHDEIIIIHSALFLYLEVLIGGSI